jgi:hypothetical protein
MKRDVILWTGVLAGPIVWLFSFEANYALAPWACTFQAKIGLYLVSLAALVLCALSGTLAWREWTALGKQWPGGVGGSEARSRIMAIGGVLMSAMFFLVVLAQAIPSVVLQACE